MAYATLLPSIGLLDGLGKVSTFRRDFPWLSAYVGHDDILGTETYLTATPELLGLAAHRFRRRYPITRNDRTVEE